MRKRFTRLLTRDRRAPVLCRGKEEIQTVSLIITMVQAQKVAVLSCYDKRGLLDLVKGLIDHNTRILASGGNVAHYPKTWPVLDTGTHKALRVSSEKQISLSRMYLQSQSPQKC